MPSHEMESNLEEEDALDMNATVTESQEYIDYGNLIERIVYVQSFAVPMLFAVIFVIGLIGNGILIYAVVRNKTLRTKPNVYIVSVAIGDFLLVLFSVPFTSVVYTTDEWLFGEAVCKLNESMQTLSLGISIFSLTALSGDRFVAIVFPMSVYKASSLRKTIIVSTLIWVLSIALACPDLVSAHVKFKNILVCDLYPISWGPSYGRFRPIVKFVIFFFVPLVIIATFYVIIAVVLLRKSDFGSHENTAMRRQMDSRKKVAKITLSFVVIFVFCWLPRHVFVIGHHYDLFDYNMFWHFFQITGFCLTFVYSSVNPFVLYFLNEEFRKYFEHYLFGCCCRSRRLSVEWLADQRPSYATYLRSLSGNISLRDRA